MEDELAIRRNRKRLEEMDFTIESWRKAVASAEASLQRHIEARQRFAESLEEPN